MNGITVNLLVEITIDGKTKVYKVSNGNSFVGALNTRDIENLANFSTKQVVARALTDFQGAVFEAQDAVIMED